MKGNMQIVSRHLFFLSLFLLCFSASQSHAEQTTILTIDNLALDSIKAKEEGVIVLVLVTLPTCSTCEYVKTNIIEPMLKAGDFDEVAIVRELSLEDYFLIDFDGNTIEASSLAHRYDADFAPTVLFLSPDGDQLHKPIIGLASRDYYGFYLEKAIKKSVKLLNQ